MKRSPQSPSSARGPRCFSTVPRCRCLPRPCPMWPGSSAATGRRSARAGASERRSACPSLTGNSSGRMADMTLPALPEESFQRVLCVVAHPDDMEYGTSAAVARWTVRGIEVGYLLLTHGFDQADHRAAGLATLDAVRDAGNRWVFPEQADDEDLEPHAVRWLIVPGLAGSGATHGVEVTGEP